MFPVLLTIGKFSVSSYGVFLALGIIFGIFLIWRLSRAWDLDEEKTLDLTLLTILGGMLVARVVFVIENFNYFIASPMSAILVYKIPGFSFSGGILGGAAALYFLAKRNRMDFWQVADIAAVGFLGGLAFVDIGCFAGGCNIGAPSKAIIAVSMVGFPGKRWPVQLIESFVLIIGLLKIWSTATHFHQRGKIICLTLIYVGIIKFLLDFLKENHNRSLWTVGILTGFVIYYRITKQNPILHLNALRKSFTLQNFNKTCYNQKANFLWQIRNIKKTLRRFNVKFSRKNP